MYTRILEKSIKNHLFKGKVIILYGPRQVGKTTLVKKIMVESGKEALYFQCDIPSQRSVFSEPEPEKIIRSIGSATLVIIDEAQLIENIGVVLKVLVDTYPHIQFIATGSSSFDLANKVREPLTGRAYEYMLYPLSLEEVLQTKSLASEQHIREYSMRFGWYPNIIDASEVESTNQLEILQQNTLYKDIFALEDIKKPKVLSDLVKYLAFNIGSVVNANNIANEIKTSAKTVERYIDILEKMFVIVRLYGFSGNLGNEVKKGSKIYFVDLGIRNSIIKNHNMIEDRSDKGALFENYFIIERMKYLSNHQVRANHYYWKTYRDMEVDYIEERDGGLEAFECKYTAQSSKGLLLFQKEYSESKSHIIHTENYTSFVLPK
jgi:uncharacterized protein